MKRILSFDGRMKYDIRCKPIEYYIVNNGCWICINRRLDKTGYHKIKHQQKSYRLSRFIYENIVGDIPEGYIIRHKCDNPNCINPEHMELGTYKQNSEDRDSRDRNGGRFIRGERNGNSKLTSEDIKEIRNSNLSSYKLADIYGISQSQINRIKLNKRWKHI